VTSYIRVIASQAQAIDENAKAQTFNVIESLDADYVFKYVDTNSSRAEINTISSKLKNLKVAIIGAGGTGSYVLDFVAKTPVKEIHLFDGDVFFLHNAFRAPGAASVEQLLQVSKKVKYLHDIYSKMHRYIFPHEEHLDGSNLEQLLGMSFIFICIDNGNAKKVIVEKLIGSGIPFVDVGIGVQALGNKLGGSVRITTGTATKHDHINDMIPFNDNGNDDY
jgi:tRNA A37 threonylcarbamoyladenosine dehydratase